MTSTTKDKRSKMQVYPTYYDFATSNIFDKWIATWFRLPYLTLLILTYYQGFVPVIPFFVILIRPLFVSYQRMTLTTIVMAFFIQAELYLWLSLFIFFEVLRACIIYLPEMFNYLHLQIRRDAVNETAFKKIVTIIREIGRPANWSFELLIRFLTLIFRDYGDESNPFTDEEFALFEKFFTDFNQSQFVIDGPIRSIFFPSFILSFDLDYRNFFITGLNSISLVARGLGENCPICLSRPGETMVELSNCKHRYCFSCIFKWINGHYDCPLCRGQIN